MLDDEQLELQVKLGEQKDENRTSKLYRNVLSTIGALLILGVLFSVFWHEFTISVQEVAAFSMGVFLVIAAFIWKKGDSKKEADLEHEIKLKSEKQYEGFDPKNL